MISFLDTTIENPHRWSQFCTEIHILDLVYFQICKIKFLKVMRSILPTDLVSFAAFKEKIKPDPRSFQQNTNDRFSENILLLILSGFCKVQRKVL
jgi:hypothetical protein